MYIQEYISTRFTLQPLKFLTVHDPQLGYNNSDDKRDFFHTQLGFTGWRSSVSVDMANALVGSAVTRIISVYIKISKMGYLHSEMSNTS